MSIESEQINKPLEIRGHHLLSLISLFSSPVCPSDEKLPYSEPTAKFIAEYYACNVMKTASTKEVEKLYEGYTKDVFGSTIDESVHVLINQITLFKRLLTLPDEYPVKILIEQPDDICRNCAIGNHCKLAQDDEIYAKGIMGDKYEENITLRELRNILTSFSRRSFSQIRAI